jgi:hypothetical protein
MSKKRSNRVGRYRSDAEVLARVEDVELLRAVAAGRVVRGSDGLDRGIAAPHLLNGQPVRLSLRRLADEGLVVMTISGSPVLDARGRRLLELANGEVASTHSMSNASRGGIAGIDGLRWRTASG